MAEEKPSGNKVIVSVALFFILGFIINLFLNYNQNNVEKKASVEELIKVTAEHSNQLTNLSNRLTVLEDNLKNSK